MGLHREIRRKARPVRVSGAAALAVFASLLGTSFPAAAQDAKKKSDTPIQRRLPLDHPLLKRVTITKQSDLQFGRLVMLGGSADITVPARGLPSYTGAVPADGGAPTAARFEIRGPANHLVEVQLVFPLSGSYGDNGSARLDGMSVEPDFSKNFEQVGSMVRVKLDPTGSNAINIGAKLTLSTSNTVGRTDILFPITASVAE